MSLGGKGPFRLGPGQITDDSEMAMAILHGLVPNSEAVRGSPQDVKHPSVLPLDIAGIQMYFNRWINSPPFDIGNTTRQALHIISNPKAGIKKENFRPSDSFQHTLEATYKSQSNGCLMRITPLAVWGHRLSSKEDLYNAVLLQTALTHQNKFAVDACYLYCFAIGILINTGDLDLAYKETKKEAGTLKQIADVEPISSWFEQLELGKLQDPCGHGIGYLKIAFQWAFYYLWKKVPYYDAVSSMIAEGGDTDTNAAIVGGLLGAAYRL